MALLVPPEGGVAIRMYRIGHGDCFLLAFPREGGGDPVHVLIDCGYKPGSPGYIHQKTIEEIVAHIADATNSHLDLVIATHEHQDHLNGIWKQKEPYFDEFEIEKAWLAWTEDPTDDLANDLRKDHKDQLLGLIEARRQLALAVGDNNESINRLDSLLSLELGGADNAFDHALMFAAAGDPEKSVNKQGLKLFKDKASQNQGVLYLNPGDEENVPGTENVRVFVLGPPRRADLLQSEDPVGDEGFPGKGGAHGLSFSSAAQARGNGDAVTTAPFRDQFRVSEKKAKTHPFFREHYGQSSDVVNEADGSEVSPNAPWRQIDSEWLFAAENLALKLNKGINNTSLVLAFELPKSKKVLLFAADAQRGNWISWDDNTWKDGPKTTTAKDLLGRTVLYKVGHHGSHNATLDGQETDTYPNLSWMAKGKFAGEFTAMITAVNEWAMKQKPPWVHPLPSIEKELKRKAQGRVFRTDIDVPKKPSNVSATAWKSFRSRSEFEELYFDYFVFDK